MKSEPNLKFSYSYCGNVSLLVLIIFYLGNDNSLGGQYRVGGVLSDGCIRPACASFAAPCDSVFKN